MIKLLVIGKNSFIAKDFQKQLNLKEYDLTWFSRGFDSKHGDTIYGQTNFICQNKYFDDNYNCVINFSILKDKSIQENIDFIDSLLELAKEKKVDKFVHFSSVIVYPYDIECIDESSVIEKSFETWKGNYAKIKISVDEYILSRKDKYNFNICLVRPGYVYDESHQPNFSKKILPHFQILLGDKRSILPTIQKVELQKALIELIKHDGIIDIVHFFNNGGTNRYGYMKLKYHNDIFLYLNRYLFYCIPRKLFSFSKTTRLFYSRLESLFVTTDYRSTITSKKLNINL